MAQKVLIIEDEFLVAMDLENIVSQAGYEVVGVVPDRATLQAISERPEIALVDLNLRDGPTGPLLAAELAETLGTKIIYVTANPAQIGTPAPTALGIVQKPFSKSAVEIALAIAETGQCTCAMPRGLTLFPTFSGAVSRAV